MTWGVIIVNQSQAVILRFDTKPSRHYDALVRHQIVIFIKVVTDAYPWCEMHLVRNKQLKRLLIYFTCKKSTGVAKLKSYGKRRWKFFKESVWSADCILWHYRIRLWSCLLFQCDGNLEKVHLLSLILNVFCRMKN